ncbi:uncharacterized protein LOC120695861 [Panicum virgatum]|uniref:uncharacterized protein LOC120695861 n=1 Tax=Panicum virgatum TaxID=38727 RepID=UPI0019D5029F|nr:uncharacterized protein LOC120695861 [Panicum virgatum]
MTLWARNEPEAHSQRAHSPREINLPLGLGDQEVQEPNSSVRRRRDAIFLFFFFLPKKLPATSHARRSHRRQWSLPSPPRSPAPRKSPPRQPRLGEKRRRGNRSRKQPRRRRRRRRRRRWRGKGEEEEEGECGFCLFMKAGGCKDAFVAWEECVEAAQKEGADMVERCYEVTANLKTCMEAHADYYAPLLQAEQAINERAEAAAAAAEGEPASDGEKKGEAVPQQDAPASPASGEGNKGEAVAEKV